MAIDLASAVLSAPPTGRAGDLAPRRRSRQPCPAAWPAIAPQPPVISRRTCSICMSASKSAWTAISSVLTASTSAWKLGGSRYFQAVTPQVSKEKPILVVSARALPGPIIAVVVVPSPDARTAWRLMSFFFLILSKSYPVERVLFSSGRRSSSQCLQSPGVAPIAARVFSGCSFGQRFDGRSNRSNVALGKISVNADRAS